MSVVKIDFNGGATPPTGWNAIDTPATTGVRIADLLDDTGAATGISIDQILSITGGAFGITGAAGDHHGWPNAVWTPVWNHGGTTDFHVFTLDGFTSGDKLAFRFAGFLGSNRDTFFGIRDSSGVDIGEGTKNYDDLSSTTPQAPVEIIARAPADGIVRVYIQENNSANILYLTALELAINETSSAALRATQVPIEVLSQDNPTLRVTQVPLEVLSVDENPTLRATQVVLEVLSTVATLISVPDVTGLSQEDAETALIAEGLILGTVTEAYSDVVTTGLVISQDPVEGALISPGSAVAIVVSLGVLSSGGVFLDSRSGWPRSGWPFDPYGYETRRDEQAQKERSKREKRLAAIRRRKGLDATDDR